MANQVHRHRAAEALYTLEKLGDFGSIEDSTIAVTADQLRKSDPRKNLSKWGVTSLREHVKRNQESREERSLRTRRERERIKAKYAALITALERNTDSPKAKELLDEIALSDWHLRLFLRWNPEWKPRLRQKLLEIKRASEKARMNRERKEAEKQRAKTLRNAIQKHSKVR